MNLRPRLLTTAAAFLTILAGCSLWWQSERSQALLRELVLAQAEQRSLHLADAMTGQVEALIAGMDLKLLELRREWMRDPVAFDPLARAVMGTLPRGLVTQLTITDATGLVVYDSKSFSESTDLRDREHFLAQRANGAEDQMLIGKPQEVQDTKAWSFVVNRSILRGGVFDGTVNFLVSTDFVSKRLATLQLPPKDVVALVYSDGTFLARSRDNLSSMGRQVPWSQPFLAGHEPKGVFRLPGLLDDTSRLYGWQQLPESGLVMVIGLADESVLVPLAPALANNRNLMAMLVILLTASGALIVALSLRAWRNGVAGEALRIRLFESSHVPTVVIDAEGNRFLECNPAACTIYGFETREEVVGKTPLQVSAAFQYDGTASEDKARFYIEKVKQEGGIVFEWLHQRPDGEQWDGEVHLMRFESDGQALLQFTLHDITSRKRTEAALRNSEARLCEAQRLARIGNWQMSFRDRKLSWSEETFRIFECDPVKVQPSYAHFLNVVHPEDRDMVNDTFIAWIDSRQPYDVVHRLLMPDGRVKHVRESGFTQFENDKPTHSVGTVQDITDI